MPFVNVTSPSQEGLEVYAHLSDAKLRASDATEHGLFIAESRRVIERALDHDIVPWSLFVEDRWLEQSRDLIERMETVRHDLPVFRVTHEQMTEVTGFQITRGPLAAFKRPAPMHLVDILDNAHRIAVLEDITNFTNIGSIFRSAAALGIDGIICSPRCHDPLYKRAARVSMGAVFKVPWVHLKAGEWPAPTCSLLHEHGFAIAAMDLAEDALAIDDARLRGIERLALVLGTEGDGLSVDIKTASDIAVKIPMSHEVDSLNVAAASSLAFWELRYRD